MILSFQIRTHVDPETNCTIPYTPHGRFIHIPPPCPSSDWANDFGRPWWKDDEYLVGILSKKTRMIKIINTLTSQEQVIEVGNNVVLKNSQALKIKNCLFAISNCLRHFSPYSKFFIDSELGHLFLCLYYFLT